VTTDAVAFVGRPPLHLHSKYWGRCCEHVGPDYYGKEVYYVISEGAD
jgi:hypothetical protein